VPSVARGSVTSRLATAEEAALLELAPPAALLVEQRLISDADGIPVELTESRYAGERYVFDVELHRVGPSGHPRASEEP
jgi:GntR family transcriptional regulator